MWASSTANALRISVASKAHLSPFSFSRCFSSVLDGLKYSSSHEWVKHEGAVAKVGISDHAQVIRTDAWNVNLPQHWQGHLGEVVFVDFPETGGSVTQGGSLGAVESVKATSDVLSPITGEIVEVNPKLKEAPGLINSSPYEDGWIIKVKPGNPSELESLMGPKEYAKFCEEEDAAH